MGVLLAAVCAAGPILRPVSAWAAVAASSGRGIAAAGVTDAQVLARAAAVDHHIGNTDRRGGADDGEAGLFHDASPFKGGWFQGKCPPSQIKRGKQSPATFREGAEYFFAGFLPRNNTWRPLENYDAFSTYSKNCKNMLAYPKQIVNTL